jgi:hypothetical protein
MNPGKGVYTDYTFDHGLAVDPDNVRLRKLHSDVSPRGCHTARHWQGKVPVSVRGTGKSD